MFHALPLMGLPESRFGLSLRVRPSTIEGTFLNGEALLAIGGSQPAETAEPTTRRATMPTKAPKETKASKAPKAAKASKEKAQFSLARHAHLWWNHSRKSGGGDGSRHVSNVAVGDG
jgi:hypothetical protein